MIPYPPIEIIHLCIAMAIGLIIGIERGIKHKSASVRTFAILGAGCCLFTIISQIKFPGFPADPTRIASNILTGLGFIGAGVIYKSDQKVEGVTTAALIWYTAAISMACGFGRIDLAIWGTIAYFIMWIIGALIHRMIRW